MTTTVTLTEESVRASIKANIDAMGEGYVYEKPPVTEGSIHPEGACLYVHNGSASCLIGRILFDHGVPLDVLSCYEGNAAYTLFRNIPGLTVDDDLLARLMSLQRLQDESVPWGKAAREVGLL